MSLLDGIIGSGNGSVTVKTDGVELPKRAKVNFTSDGSIDVDGADATDTSNVTLKHANTGGGSLHTKAGTSAGFVAALSAGKNCFTPTCTNSASTYDSHTFTRREVNVASYLPITNDFVSAVHAARDELQRLNYLDYNALYPLAPITLAQAKRGGRIIFPQGDYVATTKIDFEGWTGLELHAVGGAGYTCQTRIIWNAVPAGHTTTGTSSSTRTITGTGSISFDVGTGQYIRSGDTITFTASGGTITGVVQAGGYSGANVTLTITSSTGAGTFSSWTWASRNKDYLISFRSTLTCSMRGIAIIKPPSAAGFVGNAVDCGHGLTDSDSYQFEARRCAVFGWDATEDTSVAFYMGGSTSYVLEQCLGLYGGYGVRASNGPGIVSNSFFGEYQQYAQEVGGFTMCVADCTFEPRNFGPKTGQQCGVLVRTASPNVTICRCYFGDSTATTGVWIKTGARCTNIEGCYFNGGPGSYAVHGYGEILNITGNTLEGGVQRVFTDGSGTINMLRCAGNYSTAALTALSTVPNIVHFNSLDYGNIEFSAATIVKLFASAVFCGVPANLPCANGNNPNLSPTGVNMTITGPTTAFTLDGLSAFPSSQDGQLIWLEYRGAQQMTVKHLSGAAVAFPFRTATGADIVFPANSGGSAVRLGLAFMTDSWVVVHSALRASHLLNDSGVAGTTVKDALNALNAKKTGLIHWASANDNGAASGVPIAFGNYKSNANDSTANKVYASVSLPAGAVVSDLRVVFMNANAERNPIFDLLHYSDDAATTLTCTVATGSREAADTTHTYTVPDDGSGWGKIYCRKSTASGIAESGNYLAIITAQVTYP